MNLRKRAVLLAVLLGSIGLSGRTVADPISWAAGPEIFPGFWCEKPFLAQAEELPFARRKRAREIIERGMAKYPESVLKRYLKKVYLVSDLTFYGYQKFSGTASGDSVYVVVGTRVMGYSDEFIEAVFHKEFSSLLLNWYPRRLDKAAWKEINPTEFRYLGESSWDRPKGKDGGAKAIDRGETSQSVSKNRRDLAAGFLSQYSKSSLENDFNEYAGALFMNDPDVSQLAKRYLGVARKQAQVIRFYASISPLMNSKFFEELRKNTEAEEP